MMQSEDPDKITADEIAENDAEIDSQNFKPMSLEESHRYCKIIECIGNAVGESADDEQRHAEQERQIILLAGECHGRGHYEPAAYAEKAAPERTVLKPYFKNLLRGSLKIHI